MTTTDALPGRISRYLEYLPAIYSEQTEAGETLYLGRFLLAFEHVLSGVGDPGQPGLEEVLDGIPGQLAGQERFFEPGPSLPDAQRAPSEFLEWLSGWVALSLRGDLDDLRQRDFIARAVSLYRKRGTLEGLSDVVSIYTRLVPAIHELETAFQIRDHSQIGVDTLIDGGAPHYFEVVLRLAAPEPAQLRKQEEVARAIIDMEKPAHTYYRLRSEVPMIQIGRSQIGVDTLLSSLAASQT